MVCRHIGEVRDEEFLDTYRELALDPEYDRTFDLLVDLRDTRSRVRGSAALEKVAGLFRAEFGQESQQPKIAIIAPTDISFGLSRMFEAFGTGIQAKVEPFRDTQSALRWLNIAPEEVEKLGL